MMRTVCYLILLLFFSCAASDDRLLKEALSSAGDNSQELEAVLNLYSKEPKDSLKYKAAKYLIENMPYHYSYIMTDTIEKCLNLIEVTMDSVKNEPFSIKDSVYRSLLNQYNSLEFKKIEDTKVVKAQFLIDNIEHSFRVWKGRDWAQHLSFDEFCEFILPYKIFEGQLLDDWKGFFLNKYTNLSLLANIQYSSPYKNSSYVACEIINKELHAEMRPELNASAHIPIMRLKTLLKIPSGSCDDYASLATGALRANGIPVGMDFTPQWPFRSLGHSWNFLHENTKINMAFEGASPTISVRHKKDHKMAKVYRRTFQAKRELLTLIQNTKDIPRVFSDPLKVDVTEEYLSTTDIEIQLDTKDPYVYLAVFNNQDWEIVAWGRNNKGLAKFDKLGKDVLYLPVRYSNNKVEAVGEPFIISLNNQISFIRPNLDVKQKLTATRKFPLFGLPFDMNMRKIGSKIQASNVADFSSAETFHVFDNLDTDITVNPKNEKYRYWRVLSAVDGFCNVAELKFFEESNRNIIGEIVGTDSSCQVGDRYLKDKTFDGDLLTFFDAPTGSDSWVGMDFKDSVAINRITCIMRGDGNEIEFGHAYELCYWMDKKWTSLGKQNATDVFLDFPNCPTDALFLLRDRTKGREERIFTYEKGNQVWW